MSEPQIIPVASAGHLTQVRELFQEYAASLAGRFCFDQFQTELAGLPGDYAPPAGKLLLAFVQARLAGCVALRNAGHDTGEMKRLYVRPAFRGRGIGRDLAKSILAAACAAGYARVRLDTLPSMRSAIQLYQSLGFRRIDAAGGENSADRIDMELVLH